MTDLSLMPKDSRPGSERGAPRMRVGVVMSSMSFGGAQRVTALLCNHWVERGDEVCLITLDSAAADCYSLDRRVRRVALNMTMDARNVLDACARNFQRMRALRRTLRDFGATVVLSFGDQTNVIAALATRAMGVRCVIAEVTDPARHRIGKLWDVLRRTTYPLASALVVQTRALLPWATAVMLDQRKVHAVRNPVRDMRPFAPTKKRRRGGTVIAVGRLAPEKAFDVLLTAFSRLPRALNEWRLVILGEGPERAALTTLAEALGISERVTLPGWVAEPGETLCEADLFVMSSHYEGFPNALLEAMACGLPAISTDCLGSREIITHNEDGLLVPIDSAPRLAAAMAELMEDEAERVRLARAALAVSQRFSLEAVVREWDTILTGCRVTHEACRA